MTELDASLRLKLVDEVTATARQIADQFGVVGAEALAGSDVASAAFEELRLREMAAREETRRLSAQLKQLKASGEGTEQEIGELSLQLVRAREEARKFASGARTVQRAHERMAGSASRATDAVAASTSRHARASSTNQRAAQGSSRSLNLVSDASKNAGRELGGTVNVVAELSYSLGTAIPGMQKTGMQMAMMGGTAYQLGAGFGVWGAAIGTVIGVMPILIGYLTDAEREAQQATEANERLTRSWLDQVDAIRQLREEQQREDRLERGEQSVEEQEAALRAAEVKARQAASRERDFRSGLVDDDRRADLDAVLEADARSFDEVREVVREQLEARGEQFNNVTLALETERVQAAAQTARRLAESTETEERMRDELASALETAREREQRESQREQLQDRASATQDRLAAMLDAQGLTGRRDAALRQAVEGGNLERATRLVGADQAQQLLAAQEAARTARLAEAQFRVEDLAQDIPERTFLDGPEATGLAQPERTVDRVRRAVQRREEPAAGPPEPDTRFLSRFAEDLDRARVRVVVEDNRTRAAVEGGGIRTPIEVDTVSSSITGGQQ